MEQENRPVQDNNQVPLAQILTIGNWIVTFILLAIPLVNIIMLIIWAASSSENPNRKNFAIASIIMWAIAIVLGIFAIIGIFGPIFSGFKCPIRAAFF